MATHMRAYRHPDDLRRLQELASGLWSWASQYHVGDLAWGRRQHLGREVEWPTALWEEDGRVVAWAWVQQPGFLSLQADPARPELVDAALAWARATATGESLTVLVLEHEKHVVAGLERHGYARDDSEPFHHYLRRPLAALPAPPPLPEGFVIRPIQDESDAARRAAVHQRAWHPSRVTEDSYRSVMRAWPYRPGLDWVAQGPDGEFAASCLVWLDERHRVGELEPVGTAPGFRRAGLARAVCLAALAALRRAGAEHAIVYPVQGHPAHPGALPLYTSLGFTPYGRTHTYRSSR
ncbi:GNAT family N-acetyltransferase [Nonomuraea sp. NPDC050783]|uniref:GNAT family N-acetyltransferase n=1 Tax=Nonomuraea sp. NPDC050783 TaxID=3154634 RepID=UPI003466B2A5